MNKNILKGKVVIEYNFDGIEVPETFDWNEMDEAIKDAVHYDTGIDWDSGVIKEIKYAPETEWGYSEEEKPIEYDDWYYADLQYEQKRNGDYNE